MAKKQETIKVRRGTVTREFEMDAWKQLPEDKYGWKPVAEAPPEVKNLTGGTPPADNTGTEDEAGKLNAADLAKKIYEAETVEAVDALVTKDEARKTVLDAAAKRKEQLQGQ